MSAKNYFFTAIIMLLSWTSFVHGQNDIRCGTKLSTKEEIAFRNGIAKIDQFKARSGSAKVNPTPYVIPVVFHILHNGWGAVNKADMKCRIDDVLLTVNGDFNGTFPGYNTTDPRFDAVKDHMDIQFVAATEDPDGNLMETPGMDWQAEEANVSYGYDSKLYDYLWWGKNNKYYLEVVIVNEPNRRGQTNGSGHAFLPVQDVVPHVTFNWRYVGTTCGSWSNNGFEKVMTHEFGHYFGLKHTFQDECDATNDGMADTPPTPGSEGCTRDVLNSCNAYANLENHMDYNTSCQNMYTQDQVTAMTYWLDDTNEAPYPRSRLWQQSNLEETGVVASTPEANFKSDANAVCINQPVVYKDLSVGLPDTRTWTFEGGTPNTSTDANPSVQYAAPGVYKVTLLSSNGMGQNTKEVTGYIHVDQKTSTAVSEDFEGTFPPDRWNIDNPDGCLTWHKRSDVGNGDSSSMVMNNSQNNVEGEKDYIRLPYYDFTSASNSQMYFDLAYTKFSTAAEDILKVQVSTDCGATWNDAYSKTNIELETTEIAQEFSNDWIPENDEHWRKEIVDLSAYDGQSNVSIRFYNISGYGTRIWIDNVNIAIENDIAPVADFYTDQRVSVCNSTNISFIDTSLGNPTSWSWTFAGGTPNVSTDQNPVITYDTPGSYQVSLTATNGNGNDTVTRNNYIVVVDPDGTSVMQDFSGTFPPTGWQVFNPDYGLAWEKSTASGNGDSSCMIMNNASNSVTGEIDEVTLQPLDMSVGDTKFTFDVAYTRYDDSSPDVLKVLASIDCGTTWTEVYSKTHTELETFGPAADPNTWVPTEASHWRTERVLLSQFKGESNVLLKFKNISGYGTVVWIDNVNITMDSEDAPFSAFERGDDKSCVGTEISFNDLSDGSPTSWAWSFPGGTPATSTEQNPVVVYNEPGTYDVQLIASNAFGAGTTILKNDIVTIDRGEDSELTEDFSGDFPPEGWKIVNPDDDGFAWGKNTTRGNGVSMFVDNEKSGNNGKTDDIILAPLDMSVGKTSFEFDVAHAQYNTAEDQLILLVSKDCGATWVEVYSKQSSVLASFTGGAYPTQDSHWRTETIDLSAFYGEPSVLIKFRNISDWGNIIFVDNINIVLDSEGVPTSDFTLETEQNGTCGEATVTFTDTSSKNPISWSWSFPGGTPETSTEQNPTVVYNGSGKYDVQLVATNGYGQGTTTLKTEVVVVGGQVLPLEEDFAGDFPIKGWQIINLDNDEIKWEKRSDAGNGDSSCLVINNADNPADKIDELVLLPLDFSSEVGKIMEFDIAYTRYDDVSADKLQILVSADCGATWSEVYNKNHTQLETVVVVDDPATDQNEPNNWIPSEASHWRKETVSLDGFENNAEVLIKFKNTSGFGTRIWIDNLKVLEGEIEEEEEEEEDEDVVQEEEEDVVEVETDELVAYPVPFDKTFKINLRKFKGQSVTVRIYDLQGKVLIEKIYTNKIETEDLGEELRREGSYFAVIIGNSGKNVLRLLKN